MMRAMAGWHVVLGLVGVATMGCGATSDIDDGSASVDGEPDVVDGALESGDELGSLESALTLSEPEFMNCSAAQKTTVRAALERITDVLYDPTESRRFVSCMKNGTLSATGTYPEQLWALLQENIPTRIRCGEPTAGHVPAPSNGSPAGREDIWFGGATSETAIAELLLHELVHTKGYFLTPNGTPSPRGLGHPGPEVTVQGAVPCQEGCIERQMAGPIVAISCLFDNRANDWGLGVTTFPDQIIPLRHEMAASTGETTLAPIGNILNTEGSHENHCSTNQVGVGIRGRYGNFVTALGMVCREGSGSVHSNSRTGATTGSTYSFTCPVDEVLVGVSGRSGWWVDALKPICANTASWQAPPPFSFHITTATPSSFGGSGGVAFSRMCPLGHAVKGLRLRYADVITRMDVVCQDLGQPGNIQTVSLPTIGAPGIGALVAEEHCPSKSAMTKLWGVAEAQTDKLLRLGAGCSTVANAGPGQTVSVQAGAGDTNHMLAFAGRWEVPESGPPGPGQSPAPGTGVGRTATCPAGAAYVGLKTYHNPNGSSLLAVRGLCADAEDWSDATTMNDSWFLAGDVGTYFTNRIIQEEVCPPKHFLTGWRIAEEPDVTNIGLRCRQF